MNKILNSQAHKIISDGDSQPHKIISEQESQSHKTRFDLEPQNLCWIEVHDVSVFLHLGANQNEQAIGQNLKLNLRIQIPYRNTDDNLLNTVDYGYIINRITDYISGLTKINLLEYLAELILNFIEREFSNISAAELKLFKSYVPLANFTGNVAIEVSRNFKI